jgi:uncharacterized protein YggE
MTRARLILLAAVIAAMALGAAVGRPEAAQGDTASAKQITVQGSGTVDAVPDKVAFSFGVQTSAKTASAALSANATASQKLLAALEQAGIAKKDIRTDQVTLNQRRSEDGLTVTGYEAFSSVTATLPSLAKAGEVIDAAVNAGADSVNGPMLTLSNQKALERKALAAAVADARARAQALAEAGGVTLGAIQAMTEGGAVPPPMPYAEKSLAADAMGGPPIEPGTQQVYAWISVTFAAS